MKGLMGVSQGMAEAQNGEVLSRNQGSEGGLE